MTDSQHPGDWAHTLLSGLTASGVRDFIVSPGSRSTNLVLAIQEAAACRPHVIIDERVAGFAALGLAKRSGQPVGLVCTSGSAGAHYLPAVIEAQSAGIPLILITADRPPEAQYTGSPQTTQQMDLYGRHVKAKFDLGAPSIEGVEWTTHVATVAVQAAVTVPRAPVHINARFRKPFWTSDSRPGRTQRQVHVIKPKIDPAGVLPDALMTAIGTAQRGLIVVGPNLGMHDSHRDVERAAILSFAQNLGWPILGDVLSGMRIPECQASGVIAHADLILRDIKLREELRPDCIISIGRPPTSKVINAWLSQSDVSHIRFAANGLWTDPDNTATILLDGSPTLLETVPPHDVHTEWQDHWTTAEREIMSRLDNVWSDQEDSLREPDIPHVLSQSLTSERYIHVASGLPVRDFDAFFSPIQSNHSLVGNRGVNGIDGMIATTLGLALRNDTPPPIAVVGDIASRHDLAGFLAAAESGHSMTVIVVDNGGGAIFKRLPIAEHDAVFEPFFLTPQQTPLSPILDAIADTYIPVATRTEFAEALKRSCSCPGLTVIYAQIDTAADARFRDELAQRIGTQGTLST